jgi:hypothetical protein
MPDDHSEVVPLLPIPNRTVKRLSADDSAGSRVKVGHRQASMPQTKRPLPHRRGRLRLRRRSPSPQLPLSTLNSSAPLAPLRPLHHPPHKPPQRFSQMRLTLSTQRRRLGLDQQ